MVAFGVIHARYEPDEPDWSTLIELLLRAVTFQREATDAEQAEKDALGKIEAALAAFASVEEFAQLIEGEAAAPKPYWLDVGTENLYLRPSSNEDVQRLKAALMIIEPIIDNRFSLSEVRLRMLHRKRKLERGDYTSSATLQALRDLAGRLFGAQPGHVAALAGFIFGVSISAVQVRNARKDVEQAGG